MMHLNTLLLRGQLRLLFSVLCILHSSIHWAYATQASSSTGSTKDSWDLHLCGHLVGRYMTAHDMSSLTRRNETRKLFIDLFDPEGREFFTKGPRGEHSHHRGICVGWYKIGFKGRTLDRWHIIGGEQVVLAAVLVKETIEKTRAESTVHWQDEDDVPSIIEKRSFRIRPAVAPAYVMIDVELRLQASRNDALLDGDPEHAGIHYRPSDQIERPKTSYNLPDIETKAEKSLDSPWIADSFVLRGKTYSILQFSHPANPARTRYSSYQDYGRMGMLPRVTIAMRAKMMLLHRFLLSFGNFLPPSVIQSIPKDFTGKNDPVPAVPKQLSDVPPPPKPKKDAAKLENCSNQQPVGVFDFDLRGENPAEQIHSLDGIGFNGITVSLQTGNDLATLEAYQKAKPNLKVFAGLYYLDHSKPNTFDRDHFRKVVKKLSMMNAKVWLILNGHKGAEDNVVKILREAADIAASNHVGISLYPHHKTAMETAEEALVILKKADRHNLSISVHQCHELRLGNVERLDEVMTSVAPYMDIATICGSDRKTNYDSQDWKDAIKPLGEGDYDPREFLRALKRHNFKGPIILHTFGLKDKPVSHYRKSFELLQKMQSEVASEPSITSP